MGELRFDGKVAVITGAGRGIGRLHAHRLAERGARVVVNDVGAEPDGRGPTTTEPATTTVAEIVADGGVAIGDFNNISTWEGATALVQGAVDEYGGIDILINNAGIAYTFEPFGQTSPESYQRYIRVNLDGTFFVTRAAWEHLIASGAGRVIMTTSTSGYFGFPGQSPYIASKMGVSGLIRALSVEGAEYGIRVNGIAPSAYTRLVDRVVQLSPNDRIGNWMRHSLDPEYVVPMTLWLAHESCNVNGNDYDVAAGRISRVLMNAETRGYVDRDLTPETVADHLDEIHDTTEPHVFVAGRNHLGMLQGLFPVPPAGGGDR